MAILYDARGNEYHGLLDQVGGQTITDARVAGATLGAANAEVVMDLNGKTVAVFEIRTAANSATYVFEGSVDGTNYFTLMARGFKGTIAAVIVDDTQTTAVVVATTAAAAYVVGVSGLRRVRCRVSAYVSGNAVVTGRASGADYAIIAQPQPTTLWVTATAGAGTAITLTLNAGATGLYHYITHIDIARATNVAEAAAAPLVVTTTNLPGNPAWTVGAVVVLGSQTDDMRIDFTYPLKSTLAATATTIVAPDPGTSSIWRLNCGYYLGA